MKFARFFLDHSVVTITKQLLRYVANVKYSHVRVVIQCCLHLYCGL